LSALEKLLLANNKGEGYLVGSSVSLADFMFYAIVVDSKLFFLAFFLLLTLAFHVFFSGQF
jgi:hypothetical protein